MIELLMLVLFIVNVGMAYFLYQQDVEIEKIKKCCNCQFCKHCDDELTNPETGKTICEICTDNNL